MTVHFYVLILKLARQFSGHHSRKAGRRCQACCRRHRGAHPNARHRTGRMRFYRASSQVWLKVRHLGAFVLYCVEQADPTIPGVRWTFSSVVRLAAPELGDFQGTEQVGARRSDSLLHPSCSKGRLHHVYPAGASVPGLRSCAFHFLALSFIFAQQWRAVASDAVAGFHFRRCLCSRHSASSAPCFSTHHFRLLVPASPARGRAAGAPFARG